MEKINTKKITGLGILISIEIVLTLISTLGLGNLIVNINLGLIPICIGGCLYGPMGGLLIGLANGIVNLFGCSNLLSVNLFGTIILCLGKTSFAGFICGFVNKNNKFNKFTSILSCCLVPIINTGLFLIGSLTIYYEYFKNFANSSSLNYIAYLYSTFIGVNFLIEFLINMLLSPAVYRIIKIVKRR